MNSKVSLPPISDILSNNNSNNASINNLNSSTKQPAHHLPLHHQQHDELLRAYAAATSAAGPSQQPTYQYSPAPVLIQQVPVQQPSGIPLQNGSMMAAPAMIAASPMTIPHSQNQMYPMVPMPSYRLINPQYHISSESAHLPNASFTYRYPMTMPQPQQQPPLQTAPTIHSALAVTGSSGLRALIVLELSTKASTPALPTSLTLDRVNRMTPERVSEMVRRPSPPPPVRGRTRNNLPKETTYILLKWLEEHLNHPYPNSFEKTQLMFSTGLNQQQLSNWFINARRRKIRAMKQRQKV